MKQPIKTNEGALLMKRFLLKNNQDELKALSEADLVQLTIRGVIKYDTRLLCETTKLWSKAGTLPFFQKLTKSIHQSEIASLKNQYEKLTHKLSVITDEKEHYQFLTNQKDKQNKELVK
jgi:hypothetical protein